ncbi:alpha-hydroxy acid oxidase [Actinoplanes sp. NPDC051851]|uniref:alpha-hydroxy acid oxidase n=1 Tax=Actinoplanes sp. NPDC051851 TaxID=3154753 RepID=UPI0034218F23
MARAVLDPAVRDFVAGGSGAEITLAANRAALDGVFLRPRVLRDVAGCTTGTRLLGRPASVPVAIAPVAYQRLLHPEGELATARAAAAAGVPFIASTLSSVAIEELTTAGGDVWFQVYWLRDTGRTLDLVARAEAAGCRAVVLTVDVPWMARRLRDLRNGFTLPAGVRAANLETGATAHTREATTSAVARHTAEAFSPALSWDTVGLLRRSTRLPVVLKGILAPEDARRAVDSGVDAIVVSNHGGRQLDGALPAVDALAEVVAAVDGGYPVLVDGAIGSGTDVVRALALGAAGVLVGRPVCWALAAGGEPGVARALDLLTGEIRDALGLAGCATVAEAAALGTVRGPAR